MSKKKKDEEFEAADIAAVAAAEEHHQTSLEELAPSEISLTEETLELARQEGLIGQQEELIKEDPALELVPDEELPSELSDTEVKSVLESLFFAANGPLGLPQLRGFFKGTNIDGEKLKHIIVSLQTDYAGGDRGICLDEVAGGYQVRTKIDNARWIKKLVKGRAFKLSGPALEVLSIIAYKQPVVKNEVDQIRGVESGHLVRALMEKNLVRFVGKSELPGKPMLYGTTKDFLELFGLRNIRELPSLSEIDELIPEGIGAVSEIQDSETLGTLTEKLGLPQGKSYSDSENELLAISSDLDEISTTTEFFEQEKKREKERRDNERAQDLRERKIVGEEIPDADQKWLDRFEAKLEQIVDNALNDKPLIGLGEEAPSAPAAGQAPALATDSTIAET